MEKPNIENGESYFSLATHSKEIFMDVLFTRCPYWFSCKSSGHQMVLTQTGSSRFLVISQGKIIGSENKLNIASYLDLVAAESNDLFLLDVRARI